MVFGAPACNWRCAGEPHESGRKRRKPRLAAGHGLDYINVGAVAALPFLEELNIGHSIIARAVLVGMERAVADMRAAIAAGAGGVK